VTSVVCVRRVRRLCWRVQAYAALGGQDGSKAKWAALGGHVLESEPVAAAVAAHEGATAAQVLLRWAVQRGCSVTPKSANAARMAENAACLGLRLTDDETAAIDALAARTADEPANGRLCWRTDPLRLLDFE
jgi:diketogulonate reductase-like aldo/keto reductase